MYISKSSIAISIVLLCGCFVAAAVAADEAAEEPVVEVEAVEHATSTLVISSAWEPGGDVYYNAGDRHKLFLSVELYASSTEALAVDRLSFIPRDSISSGFLNPGMEGGNIRNLMITDGRSGSLIDGKIMLDASDNAKTFLDLDLVIASGSSRTINVYADVNSGIVDRVASRIELVKTDEIGVRGAESGKRAVAGGGATGKYIDLTAYEPKPDLIVSDLWVSQGQSQNNLIVGETSYLRVIYENTGQGKSPESFGKTFDFGGGEAFRFANEGRPISSSSEFSLSEGELLGSESYTEIYVGIFYEDGEIPVTVSVDPEDEVGETDDLNNIFTKTVSIDSELKYPDFVVYDIEVTPSRPVAREEARIDVIYKNIGSDYIQPEFPTKTYFGYIEGWFIFSGHKPMQTSRSYPSSVLPLETGDTFVESYWGWFNRPREITLEAVVDPFYQVEEANETNNSFEKRIVVVSGRSGGGAMADRLKGRIVLRVEENGEAYYINPVGLSVHSLGRPADAFAVMREQGVGIKTADLSAIPVGLDSFTGADTDGDGLPDGLEDAVGSDPGAADTDGDGLSDYEELERGSDPTDGSTLDLVTDLAFAARQHGKIFLQVEQNGEAWYVSPVDGRRYFLGRPADAFAVMRNLGLGIAEKDFTDL